MSVFFVVFFYFHPAEHLVEWTPELTHNIGLIVSEFPAQQMGACRKHKSRSLPAWLLLLPALTVVDCSTQMFEHDPERQSNAI